MKRIISIALAIILTLSITPAAKASTTASDYFARTRVAVYALGNGKLLIEADVGATHPMTKLGVHRINILEKQPDGYFLEIDAYTLDDYPDMLETDTFSAYYDATYQGVAGREYYVGVIFYAENDQGNEYYGVFSKTIVLT